MWTLFKSVLMFFKKSKILLIGLIILIFSSSLIFTAMHSVSNNLQTSYNSLSANGKLNDFVINEKYTLGIAEYSYTIDTAKNEASIKPSVNSLGAVTWTNSYLNFYEKYKLDPIYSKYLLENIYTNKTETLLTDDEINLEINNMKIQLSDYVNNFIQEGFTNELNKLPIRYRPYKAIDISNNQQNIFYKVVETSPDYSINKLVLYNGSNVLKPYLSNDIENIINNFLLDTNNNSRKLLYLMKNASWADKEVSAHILQTFNYFEENKEIDPYNFTTTSSSESYLKNVLGFSSTIPSRSREGYLKQIVDQKRYSNKNFKIDFNISSKSPLGDNIPVVGSLFDYSSYQAVVMPSYLDNFNKKIFSSKEFNTHLSDNEEEFNTWFKSIDNKYKIIIDSTEYLIMGSGISPDYMYPVVSFDRPVPNYFSEAIVYSNEVGYSRIKDAFRGNNVENFLVGVFDNKNDQQIILNKINQIAINWMSWPHGTKAAYLIDDLSNTIYPAALRLQFIPNTLEITTIISTFLTLVVLFLSIIVSIFVIKRFIENNKNSLGILLANGFKKREIILAIVLFLLIPIFFGTVLGFMIGFAIQVPIMSLFTSFWTIPILGSNFSGITFIVVILVQIILFSTLGSLFTWFSLRGETSELMKDEAKYKMSKFAMLAKRPFTKFGIMTIFRSAVAFQSLWRLFLLSLMSCLTILSIVFSIATNNKFNQAAIDTYKSKNYAYSYKLITPTKEAGQYYAVPYQYAGMTLSKETYFNNNVFDLYSSIKDPISQNYLLSSYYSSANKYPDFTTSNPNLMKLMELYGNYQLLSATDDNSGQATKLQYLKNKTQNQISLDHFLGIFGIGANPWQIAKRLMPTNQVNYANRSFKNMLEGVLEDITEKVQIGQTEYSYRDALLLFTKPVSPKIGDPNLITNPSHFFDDIDKQALEFDSKKLSKSYSGIENFVLIPDFVEFILNLFKTPKYFPQIYNVTFNKVIIDEGDRPYSYIDFTFASKNNSSFLSPTKETIIGINNNDDYLNLTNYNNEKINYKLFEKDEKYIPIIVNAYAQKKYDLNIGDIFQIKSENKADRYKNPNSINIISDTQFKVTDILTTYQGSEFFISHENANKFLGLINILDPTNGNFDYQKSGFNGVFSRSNDLALITKGISLYSPSGIYPAIDLFNPDDSNLIKLFEALAPSEITTAHPDIKTNLDWAKFITGINAINSQDLIKELANKYGSSASYYVLTTLNDKNSMEKVFLNLGSTINNVQISIITVIIAISLVIVILISTMIVLDSIKLASYLKCLGLNDWKNALSFLVIYLPIFVLGLALAVPFVYLLIFIYVEMIFNSAGILLIVTPDFLSFFIPMICVLAVFFLSFLIAWYKIKRTNLPRIIK